MKSNKAKVLHEMLGVPMIIYVVDVARKISDNHPILVIGNQAEKVREVVLKNGHAGFAFQEQQLGTGHAVRCALSGLPDQTEEVIILCGDVPLITAETILKLLDGHISAARDVSLLAVEVENPIGYGRVVIGESGKLIGIVEESDAAPAQHRIRLINTGIYCVKRAFLNDALLQITPNNAQGEYYLTDIIALGYAQRKNMGVWIAGNEEEFIGVNTPQDLMTVQNIVRKRIGNLS
jgi:UDP-N-acetylglucosamine diphosphorylase/glucosamine-1-phosphate N-acetyltransferase